MVRVVDVMGAMIDRRLTWPLLFGVVLLSNACVVTREEFDGLQRNVKNLRGEVSAMKGEPVGVEGGTFHRTDAVARLEELAAETRMIQGQIEENSFRLSEISQRLDEAERKVARLLGEPVRPGGTSPRFPSAGVPPPRPAGPTPPPPGGPPTPQLPAAPGSGHPGMQGAVPSPEKVYKDALTDYTKGNYDLAIKGFRTYLTYFPKTSLVPNAQYWLAESYYSQRKYPDAIREFDKLIKTYPESTRVPSAMLKQGYAYLELGEKPLGQGVLRELVAKYPRSREARLAQDTLEQSR
jgi:tol-pal system protein YbgF